ncbi:MAG: SAM-dependent chlorinase/fluorinase [Planctomycetia bacterium]|nr:SAM-dependent chlorinase/fluorinase [Planctomycetia bacterium]
MTPLPPVITLTTDFGADSPYVAQMKGVILSLNPAARIVDVTHSVPPQDIRQGAWTLAEVAPFWPPGTIHIAVVDPGVGTDRELVCAAIGEAWYLAPDNGLLSRLAMARPPSTIIALESRQFRLSPVSNTFHGRDILAPAAAHLSLGLDPHRLGPTLDRLMEIPWAEVSFMPGKIKGTVRSIDSFGNLITDVAADKLTDVPTEPDRVRIRCDEHETQGLFKTYADQPPMTLVAVIGSSGYLELAIVGDSAAIMLGVRAGAPISVEW